MGKIKKSLSKALEGNVDLNKKALRIKKSWDEVSLLLEKSIKKKKRY